MDMKTHSVHPIGCRAKILKAGRQEKSMGIY